MQTIVNNHLKEDRETIECEIFDTNCSNFAYKPNHKLPIHEQRPKLPMFALRSCIFYWLRK